MNILIILADALRPHHLGCYGYPLPTSPNIDRLAAEGVRCETCIAVSAHTFPPIVSLLTGQTPFTHGLMDERDLIRWKSPQTVAQAPLPLQVLAEQGWLVDGEREVVLHKPEAYTKNQTMQLSPGTRQEVPPGGMVFIRLVRNMGADGNTPGRAITAIDMETMDTQTPYWHTEVPHREIEHYMADERDPQRFYVTPPQPSPAEYAEIIFSSAPPDVAPMTPAEWETTTATISLPDIYMNPLLDYVLYRAYSKNSDSSDPNRALAYYQSFLNALGVKGRSDARFADLHERDKA